MVPVAVTAAESVEKLRAWAAGRCLDASRPGIYTRGAAEPAPRRSPRQPAWQQLTSVHGPQLCGVVTQTEHPPMRQIWLELSRASLPFVLTPDGAFRLANPQAWCPGRLHLVEYSPSTSSTIVAIAVTPVRHNEQATECNR